MQPGQVRKMKFLSIYETVLQLLLTAPVHYSALH